MTHSIVSTALTVLLGLSFSADLASAQQPEWKVPSRSARKRNPLPDQAAIVAKGKVLYTAHCVSCHGTTGVGDGTAASGLEVPVGDLTSKKTQGQSDGALFWKITTGRAPMTAFGDSLSVEERWQVVRYLRALDEEELALVPPQLRAPDSLRAQLGGLFGAYDKLRASLAKGEQKGFVAALPGLASAVGDLKEVDAKKLPKDLVEPWMQSVAALDKAVSGMDSAKKLADMRTSFVGVSRAAQETWERFGHSLKAPLIVFECQEATKTGAARWVQTSSKPDNPYCGSKEVASVKALKRIAAVRPKKQETEDGKTKVIRSKDQFPENHSSGGSQ